MGSAAAGDKGQRSGEKRSEERVSRWDLLPLSSIFVRPEQSDGENGKGLRYDLTNEIYVKSYKEAAQLRLEEATAFQQLLNK